MWSISDVFIISRLRVSGPDLEGIDLYQAEIRYNINRVKRGGSVLIMMERLLLLRLRRSEKKKKKNVISIRRRVGGSCRSIRPNEKHLLIDYYCLSSLPEIPEVFDMFRLFFFARMKEGILQYPSSFLYCFGVKRGPST